MPLNYLQVKTKDHQVDVKQTRDMVLKAVASSPWSSYGEVNHDQIELILKLYLDYPEPTTRGLFVCLDGPVLVGLLAAIISPNVVTNIATEMMWYVLPEYQKGGVGVELIKNYEGWAKEQNCGLVSLAHYNDILGERISTVYEKLGYNKIETTYIKKLD